jgi:excisionase family DNA binding protein
MEPLKVELPKEITDAIKIEVLNAFEEAKNNVYKDKFPLYLSKKQTCEYLGISNNTLNEAEINLSPELEDALKVAISTAAQKIVDDSKSKNDKWPMYMNKGTAAKYLGISYNTLSTWMDKEKVPYKHIAGSYRFNRNDLDKFMATK